MPGLSVKYLYVIAGGPTTCVLHDQDAGEETILVAPTLLEHAQLVFAALSGAKITVPAIGYTPVVRRVEPFELGHEPNLPEVPGYRVMRVATQRTTQAGEHLEAFVERPGDAFQKAYNVWDPWLQQILLASFSVTVGGDRRPALELEFAGDDPQKIVAISLGKR